MIGDKSSLVNDKPESDGFMTSGDGVNKRVLRKGALNIGGFQKFKNVLHMDGLMANLISISQICELNLHINFTHDKCVVLDEFENCVLEGSRSLNNCYTLSPSHTCYNYQLSYYTKLLYNLYLDPFTSSSMSIIFSLI